MSGGTSMEGLGVTRAQTLKVFGTEACVPGNARQHAGTEFLGIVKGEDEISPAFARESSVGACLPLELPTQPA